MIYFLKASDRIKIGYANDPATRISSIQTTSPYILEVLLIIEGNYDEESFLHRKFHDLRTSGEWFEYKDPLKSFIRDNLKLDRKYEFGFVFEDFKGNEQVLRLRKEHKLSLQSLGNKLNISAQSIKEIQDREKSGSVTIKILNKVAEALNYKFEYRFIPKRSENEG